MFLNNKFIIVFYIFSFPILSQEINSFRLDTINSIMLDEVVVTGQYNPQSVKKSIFEVKVINEMKLNNVQQLI